MAKTVRKRIRRSPEAARRLFLEHAESVLVKEGLSGVQMRAVARLAGVTDAAIAHHFKNREGLIIALMEHVVVRVRNAVSSIVQTWSNQASEIWPLVEELDRLYSQGFAELAQASSRSGWRDQGSPILKPVVDALMKRNENPSTTKQTIQRVLASLHLDLALSPLYGAAFRRSVGLKSNLDRVEHLKWWANSLEQLLKAP
ncbi:MAG: helix-turn-helix domain-containing protein [Pseudomonadota bacterium]